MTRQVLKWTVKIDDEYHEVGGGKVVLVDCQYGPDSVQVWTEEAVGTEVFEARSCRVFGTGQPIPNHLRHVGSVNTGALVWHLYAEPSS